MCGSFNRWLLDNGDVANKNALGYVRERRSHTRTVLCIKHWDNPPCRVRVSAVAVIEELKNKHLPGEAGVVMRGLFRKEQRELKYTTFPGPIEYLSTRERLLRRTGGFVTAVKPILG